MAEKNTKPVQGPGGRGPKGPRPKVENPGKLFMRLLAYIMKNYAVHCILVVICIFITVLASVQGTWFMQTLIDGYILPLIGQADPDFSGLLHAIMRVSIFYLIGALASYIYTRIMVNVSQGTLKNLRDDMFTHMEELPIRYFDTHYHGDIMSTYTNDIDTLRQMISQSMPQFLNSIITIVSVFVSMLLLNVPLTIVTLLMIGVTLFATKKIGALSAKYFIAQQKDIATVNGYIEEMMNGLKVVKSFCHEEESKKDFDKINNSLCAVSTKANRYANILMPVMGNIGNFLYVLVALIGTILYVTNTPNLTLTGLNQIQIGVIVSFLPMVKQFTNAVAEMSNQINSIAMAVGGSARIYAIMQEPKEVDDGYVKLCRGKKDADGNIVECDKNEATLWAWKYPHQDGQISYVELKGDVRMFDVDFGYDPNKIVLHDVSLYAEPGQKVAFVGATGAGKTTITNLLNRFYDIADGKIRYDGININKISKKDLRQSLAMVLQDTNLFTGTILDNIRYGRLDATDEECIEAAKLANADSFITRLPNGYNTMLKSDGTNLSQGQRQLLSIARAAVSGAPAMILDEATSSIDTRTESLVTAAMDNLMKGRTTFVIAHRLSTIRNADVIMVLDHGRIIERGTHDQLLAKKGMYYQLYTGAFELE